MSWKQEIIKGYEAFKSRIEKLQKTQKDKLFVLFTGSPGDDGVHSWCPDCNDYEEVFTKFKEANADLAGHYLIVEVGPRDYWKPKDCPFRTDPKLKLTSVPTLMQWGTGKKLDGDEILKESLLKLLFLDEED